METYLRVLMAARLAWLASLLVAASAAPLRFSSKEAPAFSSSFASAPVRSTTLLNVHIIPHSHDDLGWLVRGPALRPYPLTLTHASSALQKTADQYYTGENATIYDASVQ